MKKILGRIAIVIPAVVLQALWYLVLLGLMNDLMNEHLGDVLNGVFSILAVIFVTGLVAKREESAYKLLWVMLMVAMPILGAMLYFFLGNKSTGRGLKKKLSQSAKKLEGTLPPGSVEDIKAENKRLYQTLPTSAKPPAFPWWKTGKPGFTPSERPCSRICAGICKMQKATFIWNISLSKKEGFGIALRRSWPKRSPRVWMFGSCTMI